MKKKFITLLLACALPLMADPTPDVIEEPTYIERCDQTQCFEEKIQELVTPAILFYIEKGNIEKALEISAYFEQFVENDEEGEKVNASIPSILNKMFDTLEEAYDVELPREKLLAIADRYIQEVKTLLEGEMIIQEEEA